MLKSSAIRKGKVPTIRSLISTSCSATPSTEYRLNREIPVVELDRHVNDEPFADRIVEEFRSIAAAPLAGARPAAKG